LAIKGTQSGTVSRVDGRDQAFHVLDVQGGEDVDFGGKNLLHVLVALAVFAARNVGMREFIHQDHLRMAGQDGIHVHFLKDGPAVFEFAPRDGLELLREFHDAFAVVRLDDSDDDIFTAAGSPDALAQHAEGFAHARRIA
jgi:hypothetical protein